MGRSKAWLEYRGEYLLQRVVRLVSEVVRPVVVAAKVGQDLPPLPDSVTAVFDAVESAGPLAGIASGFDALASACEAAFVVACDHPLLKPRFIARLIDLLEDYPAVVPLHEDRLHPTIALYRLDTRDILTEMLRTRSFRATTFAKRCSPRLVRADDLADCDPDMESLRNLNDPETYDALTGEPARGRRGKPDVPQ